MTKQKKPPTPSKFTEANRALILRILSEGNFRTVAAAMADVNYSTFTGWMKDPRPEYVAFAAAVRRSECEAETRAVKHIIDSVTDNVDHAKWWLERKYPERWGRRDPEHEAKGEMLSLEIRTAEAKLKMLEAGDNPDRQTITVVIPGLTPAENEAEAAAIANDLEGLPSQKRRAK